MISLSHIFYLLYLSFLWLAIFHNTLLWIFCLPYLVRFKLISYSFPRVLRFYRYIIFPCRFLLFIFSSYFSFSSSLSFSSYSCSCSYSTFLSSFTFSTFSSFFSSHSCFCSGTSSCFCSPSCFFSSSLSRFVKLSPDKVFEPWHRRFHLLAAPRRSQGTLKIHRLGKRDGGYVTATRYIILIHILRFIFSSGPLRARCLCVLSAKKGWRKP